MPIYAFCAEYPTPKALALCGLKAATHALPTISEELKWNFLVTERPKEAFFGAVKDESFSLKLNIQNPRNSFRPYIRGWLKATPSGTRIDVLLYVNPLVTALTVLIICTLGPSLPAVLSGEFRALPPFAILVTLLGMYGFGFAVEVRRIRSKLAEIILFAGQKAS
ncbi:hypothetical protein [Niveibacterium sp. COAC-50]|uniref:hypothetical protein n=1 Tax=Niveibacterium sp. COAC-50 TaxID=2729384 RepID=UPI0015550F59|nr:hypothetical protein [Niveibacterium sp. COAC-50]